MRRKVADSVLMKIGSEEQQEMTQNVGLGWNQHPAQALQGANYPW